MNWQSVCAPAAPFINPQRRADERRQQFHPDADDQRTSGEPMIVRRRRLWEGDLIIGAHHQSAMRHVGGAFDALRAARTSAQRLRRRTGRDALVVTMKTLPSASAQILDLGPAATKWAGAPPGHGYRDADLFLRPGRPGSMARAGQRPAAPVLPQRHQPRPAHRSRPRGGRRRAERSMQNARLGNPSRAPRCFYFSYKPVLQRSLRPPRSRALVRSGVRV